MNPTSKIVFKNVRDTRPYNLMRIRPMDGSEPYFEVRSISVAGKPITKVGRGIHQLENLVVMKVDGDEDSPLVGLNAIDFLEIE